MLPDGWMGKKLLRWLAEHASRSEQVIEVGCWLGRSTRRMVDALPMGGVLFAVDHWQGAQDDPEQRHLYAEVLATRDPRAEFLGSFGEEVAAGRVVPVEMASVEAALHLMKTHGPVFDFVFLDADHSYNGCRADIEAYLPLVKRGGILAGHDYAENWPGVRRAVDERFGAPNIGPGSIWWVNV